MSTLEQKKAKIAKLKGLWRDVSKYEAKLRPVEAPKEEDVKPVRRVGRPRNE